VQAIPAVRSRRGPRRRRPAKLHADKGYDYPHLRAWLRRRRITPRIARRGVENSTRLGRHRWVVERSFAWLTGYRWPPSRQEGAAWLFAAFPLPRSPAARSFHTSRTLRLMRFPLLNLREPCAYFQKHLSLC
jgi:IS5 family transposase